MIDGQKISGLVLISKAVWGGYPFIESVKSFLPAVDEMVIVYNPFENEDGTNEQLRQLQIDYLKVRLVPSAFDIEKYGWVSYGIARTLGYQACHGDIVLMFDCDGILHENEVNLLNSELHDFIVNGYATGYWEKHRIYKPEVYYVQHKHSGIYSKKILGDRFDFFRSDQKGAPNFERLTEKEQMSKKFKVTLFGYEHVWDTEEVLKYKINRYGNMIAKQHNKPLRTSEEYFKEYMDELLAKLAKDALHMPIERHPAIVQDKLRNINETHFGFNFFNYK